MQKNTIRNVYLYLVTAVTLFMIVFAVVDMINLGLRTYVFTKIDQADVQNMYPPAVVYDEATKAKLGTCPTIPVNVAEQEKRQQDQQAANRQRDLVTNISLLVVALPLFGYHWLLIRRDRKENKEDAA